METPVVPFNSVKIWVLLVTAQKVAAVAVY
jgi:hypothetical protein